MVLCWGVNSINNSLAGDGSELGNTKHVKMYFIFGNLF